MPLPSLSYSHRVYTDTNEGTTALFEHINFHEQGRIWRYKQTEQAHTEKEIAVDTVNSTYLTSGKNRR